MALYLMFCVVHLTYFQTDILYSSVKAGINEWDYVSAQIASY
jgi:hypothetical protein